MEWFTSDLHFGHKKIIKLCDENFDTIEERDALIIKNINNSVKANDKLFILGDISWRNFEETAALLKQIRCKNIIVIKGNHDKDEILNQLKEEGIIKEWHNYLEIFSGDRRFILFHYPIEEWNGFYKTVNKPIHVFGHIHSNFLIHESVVFNKDGTTRVRNKFDVGVNANNFCPVSAKRLIELMNLI